MGKPYLGRFDISKSMRPVKDFEEKMKRIPAQPLLIARIERDNMISEIRSFGMQVGDWKSDEAVNTALQGV